MSRKLLNNDMQNGKVYNKLYRFCHTSSRRLLWEIPTSLIFFVDRNINNLMPWK